MFRKLFLLHTALVLGTVIAVVTLTILFIGQEVIFEPPPNTCIENICVFAYGLMPLFCDESQQGSVKKQMPPGIYRYIFTVGSTGYQANCGPFAKSIFRPKSGSGTFVVFGYKRLEISLASYDEIFQCIPDSSSVSPFCSAPASKKITLARDAAIRYVSGNFAEQNVPLTGYTNIESAISGDWTIQTLCPGLTCNVTIENKVSGFHWEGLVIVKDGVPGCGRWIEEEKVYSVDQLTVTFPTQPTVPPTP